MGGRVPVCRTSSRKSRCLPGSAVHRFDVELLQVKDQLAGNPNRVLGVSWMAVGNLGRDGPVHEPIGRGLFNLRAPDDTKAILRKVLRTVRHFDGDPFATHFDVVLQPDSLAPRIGQDHRKIRAVLEGNGTIDRSVMPRSNLG